VNDQHLFDPDQPPPTTPPPPALEKCPTCHGTGHIDAARLREMLERPGMTGRDHPKTSRAAGTTPKKGSQRELVLTLLALGPKTAYELSVLMGKSPNQVATRCGELHADGFVEYARHAETREIMERETTPGNTGRVHRITPAGQRVLGVRY
jgi:hypothetical protein